MNNGIFEAETTATPLPEHAARGLDGLVSVCASLINDGSTSARKRLKVIKEAIALIGYYRSLSEEKLNESLKREQKIYADEKAMMDKLNDHIKDFEITIKKLEDKRDELNKKLKRALFVKRKRLKNERASISVAISHIYVERAKVIEQRDEKKRYMTASDERLWAIKRLLDFDEDETKSIEVKLNCRMPKIKSEQEALEMLVRPEVFRLLNKDKIALYSVLYGKETRQAVCASSELLGIIEEDGAAYETASFVLGYLVASTPELYTLLSLTDRVSDLLDVKPPIMTSFCQYPLRRGGEPEPLTWLVLRREKGRALLICLNAIEAKPYASFATEGLCWENSELRKWLNGELLNTLFTKREQSCLIPTEHTIGDKTSKDIIFLPTLEDLKPLHRIPTATDHACNAYMAELSRLWLLGESTERICENDPQRELKVDFVAYDIRNRDLTNEPCDRACLVAPAVWVRTKE